MATKAQEGDRASASTGDGRAPKGPAKLGTGSWLGVLKRSASGFSADNLTDRAEIDRQVVTLARRVAQDVVEEGRPAARVAVKVRFAPFITLTRSMTLTAPSSDAEEIERAALSVLDKFEHTRPIRLLGVRAEF